MNSINLIPQEVKEEYEKSKKNKKLLGVIFIIFTLAAIFVAILIVISSYLNGKLATITKETSLKEQSLKRFGTLEEDAKKLDSRIDATKKIIQSKTYQSKSLDRIWASTPDNMFLNEVTMEKDSAKKGKMVGSASDKNAISRFMDTLEKSNEFDYVDLESTNKTIDPFTEKEIESFTITFIINEKYIK